MIRARKRASRRRPSLEQIDAVEHVPYVDRRARKRLGDGERRDIVRGGDIVDEPHDLGHLHAVLHDADRRDDLGGVEDVEVEMDQHVLCACRRYPIKRPLRRFAHFRNADMPDSVFLLAVNDLPALPVAKSDEEDLLGRDRGRKNRLRRRDLAHDRRDGHRVVAAIGVARKRDVGMRVNPQNRHVAGVFLREPREGRHADGAFSAERDYPVRRLRLQRGERRLRLRDDRVEVGDAVRDLPLPVRHADGHADGLVPWILRREDFEKPRAERIAATRVLEVFHFGDPPVLHPRPLPLREHEPDGVRLSKRCCRDGHDECAC